MTRQEALTEISNKLDLARAIISECEKIAEEACVEFDFSVTYGMGGTYYPVNKIVDEDEWSSSNEGWVASSQQC